MEGFPGFPVGGKSTGSWLPPRIGKYYKWQQNYPKRDSSQTLGNLAAPGLTKASLKVQDAAGVGTSQAPPPNPQIPDVPSKTSSYRDYLPYFMKGILRKD